jgi:hypothetical protein
MDSSMGVSAEMTHPAMLYLAGAAAAAFALVDPIVAAAVSFEARLEIERAGTQVRAEVLSMSLAAPSPDALPPYCSSLGRLGVSDGRLLRQSIGALAEVLAAIALNRVEVAK